MVRTAGTMKRTADSMVHAAGSMKRTDESMVHAVNFMLTAICFIVLARRVGMAHSAALHPPHPLRLLQQRMPIVHLELREQRIAVRLHCAQPHPQPGADLRQCIALRIGHQP